jgi:hypothetical protein
VAEIMEVQPLSDTPPHSRVCRLVYPTKRLLKCLFGKPGQCENHYLFHVQNYERHEKSETSALSVQFFPASIQLIKK